MSWKEAKVEPSPGLFPVSEAEIKRPDLKDLYLAVSSVAGQTQNSFSPSLSAILGKDQDCDSQQTLEINFV